MNEQVKAPTREYFEGSVSVAQHPLSWLMAIILESTAKALGYKVILGGVSQ